MFDPFQAVLASLILEGLKKLSEFLAEAGLPFEIKDWSALFAAALAAWLIAFGNLVGASLPGVWQAWIPFVVKFVLTFLTMIGVYAIGVKPLRSLR